MARKRKVQTKKREEIKELANVSDQTEIMSMYNIVICAQNGEAYYEKCLKELRILYKNTEHKTFTSTFEKILKIALSNEDDQISSAILKFCAQYIAGLEAGDETHPVTLSVFEWLLSTISPDPSIRFRMCQFVNLILNCMGPEAALDNNICDGILKYMSKMLLDLSQNVRVQAVVALQRLQNPDDADDPVFKFYIFHLENDPSSKVRQAVISSIGKNRFTIPYIIERLWDSDEKVRRYTYIQMSSYPVKSYQVSQRLQFLEQGLNENSESVIKVVKNIMLPNWIESYGRNYLAFVTGLKLDANIQEMERFRDVAVKALMEIFLKHEKRDIIASLNNLMDEGKFEKCVSLDQITLEKIIFWQAVIEFFKNETFKIEDSDSDDSVGDAYDLLPELSVFCEYIDQYVSTLCDDWDQYQKNTFAYILLMLIEIISKYDFGDEIGRDRLKILLTKIMREIEVEESAIKIIIQIMEELLPQTETRLEYLVNLIRTIIEPETNFDNINNMMTDYLEKHPNKELEFKISRLKLKILEIRELEQNHIEKTEYANAQEISDELHSLIEEYKTIVRPFISASTGENSVSSILGNSKTKLTKETTNKCLQIAFHMVASKKVTSLTPNVCNFYKEFIRRKMESQHIKVREWALKCGTAFSMLYDVLVIDLAQVLHQQFFQHSNKLVWKMSIRCIFELIDKYGINHFDVTQSNDKVKKQGRVLYNISEHLDQDDVKNKSGTLSNGMDLIKLMIHLLEQCDSDDIVIELIDGFCRIVLRGHLTSTDIMTKLLLKFFNPDTGNEINQMLAIFFETIMKDKKQQYLQQALLPTLYAFMDAGHESPLANVKLESVLKFVINSTRSVFLHTCIAKSFLEAILDNPENKDILKILSKELLSLDVADTDTETKSQLTYLTEEVLKIQLDSKIENYCHSFKELLAGTFKVPLTFSSSKLREEEAEDSENQEVVEEFP